LTLSKRRAQLCILITKLSDHAAKDLSNASRFSRICANSSVTTDMMKKNLSLKSSTL
jgi:hypothetical protein